MAALQERTSVESLQQALNDQNLFPESDDLHDPKVDATPSPVLTVVANFVVT